MPIKNFWKNIFIHFFIIFLSLDISADNSCLNWFKNSKISITDTACVSKCQTFQTDMSTFTCHNNCEKLCAPAKCENDVYWLNKISAGRPENWEMASEITVAWSESEKYELIKILNTLPDFFKNIPFDGFYRVEKSVALPNPGTTSATGRFIVIYDRAFDHPLWSLQDVVIHELGHILLINLKKADRLSYEKALGWKTTRAKTQTRNGPFISNRAQADIQEDFAENIKFILLAPENLKNIVPQAYHWIFKNISKEFKLKEVCKDAKFIKKNN